MSTSVYSAEAFAEFKDNPKLLRLLFDINPTLVFVKDRQGRFAFANRALAEVYGITVEDLIGKTDADFNPEIDEIEHFLEDDLRVMDTREELFIPQEKVSDPNGNMVWLQTIKRPLVDRDGSCNYVLGVAVDITARVLAEERALELRERLARSERMESLGVMAGGVAHDLNNILGPLVGYPDILADIMKDDPAAMELIEDINRSMTQATAVIQDMLTLARRGVYSARTVDLNTSVREFVDSVVLKRLRTGHPLTEFTVSVEENPLLLLGSDSHCNQILINLVTNAFEAMGGKGRIQVSTGSETLVNRLEGFEEVPAGSYVYLEVCDSGEGISIDDQQRIFEPFFSSKLENGSGSGLGLSVVYGAVRDMSGFIELWSSVGEGTCFRIRFPAIEIVDDIAAGASEISLPGEGRILVIDDLDSQRRLADRMLRSLGYEVVLAASGPEGLEQLEVGREFDLVIIDMVMPEGGDGLDTYRAVRTLAPDLPCIIASGYAESDRVASALEEGAQGFLTKPFTQVTLGTEVRRLIVPGNSGSG